MTNQLNEIETEVRIIGEGIALKGILGLPETPHSIVIFAHGSGSSRHSVRNNFVARVLQKHGHATLLMDLLSEEEAISRQSVFDIKLLSKRLDLARSWLMTLPETNSLKINLFGASTGAGAALVNAAENPHGIASIVSRGGRPDLAMAYLHRVLAPTLLLVGGNDTAVIEMNRRAFHALECQKDMQIIPGATHLFEESGTLEQVADLAAQWFDRFSKQTEEEIPINH